MYGDIARDARIVVDEPGPTHFGVGFIDDMVDDGGEIVLEVDLVGEVHG